MNMCVFVRMCVCVCMHECWKRGGEKEPVRFTKSTTCLALFDLLLHAQMIDVVNGLYEP